MNRESLADRIIQDHATYALAAGAIPVPLADIAAVTAVQVDLVRALAKVYEVEFDPATGKALIVSLLGASAARAGASIAKAVPGIGLIPGVVTQAGLSGASTYAVGHLFKMHFASQGALEDFDPESSRSAYEALLERGKDVVRSLRPCSKHQVEETTSLLERVARLREQNAIDDEEFRRLKREILSAVA